MRRWPLLEPFWHARGDGPFLYTGGILPIFAGRCRTLVEMRFRLLVFLLAPLVAASFAPSALAQSRLTGFDLLRMTPSARAAALTGAFTPGSGALSPDALFYNPSFLSEEVHNVASVGYLNHLDDVWMGFGAYSRQIEQLGGTAGIAIRHLNYGSFDETIFEGGDPIGTFGASETVLTLSYSHQVASRIQAGASLHTAHVSVHNYSASALAADLGATYYVPEAGLMVSAALRNIGVVLSSLGETEDQLPTDLRIAVSYHLPNVPLRLTLTGYDLTSFESQTGSALNELARHLALGGEFFLGQAFAVRFGYDYRRGEELSTGERLDLAGFGMGFGLNLRRVGFDYAYNAWSSFGGLHHLTVRASL